ncbi:hypothetical protein SDC9_71753 [bioreactor metagenome]|uniref:DUF2442 domain-containing protein n=1 Tax=bioreactor metagenome TaxID=1076179 RepID=A0A644YFG3_9ZZZZ
MSKITGLLPQEGYRLEVRLDNGSSVILNLESRIHTVRFGLLEDKALFQRAVTDGSYIRWDNKVEISVNELFQLAQK